MHLHATLISWRRPGLTLETLRSWAATVSVPASLVVVDNGSPAELVAPVVELAGDLGAHWVQLPENRYPGYATNRGWELAPSGTTMYQRIDNDARFLPGWCEPMVEAFTDPWVGQYGLVAEGDEPWTSAPGWPVGGFSIIRSDLYDAGLRYDERPWHPGHQECPAFAREVTALGYRWVFSPEPAIEYLDDGDWDYRVETHQARGLEAQPFTAATRLEP